MLNTRGTESSRALTRCAIYCRVSSDDGLSQAFTSLDAQQAAGESFVASQKERGWTVIPEKFHDGGYSGGTMERPALKKLIERIEAGQVEAVVVYKLDRFTRSIRDFGKLADVLEKRKVALVSVTQSIDTGTSMGRLMMHVLLSFAAFERELASERTRDKIALQRQRGRWSGGRPPLGYDVRNSELVINATEASVVRSLYGKYLELGSLSCVLEWAYDKGITNKSWISASGQSQGGARFVKSTLSQLLSSPVYIGLIPHHHQTFEGVHVPIIDQEVFRRVQERLAENATCGPSLVRNRYGGLLKGILHCGCCGKPMVHTTTSTMKRGAVRTDYRYYVCPKRQSISAQRCPGRSVQASQVEDFVLDKVRDVFSTPEMVGTVLDIARARAEERMRDLRSREALLAAALHDIVAGLASPGDRTRSEIEREISLVRAEAKRASESMPRREEVQGSLQEFDGLWATLSPGERARVIGLVVQRVTFDATKGEITITRREDAQQEVAA